MWKQSNYLIALNDDRRLALARLEHAEKEMLQAETAFRQHLPLDESPLSHSNESVANPTISAAREEFRSQHIVFCRRASHLAEIEDELFPQLEEKYE